MQYKKHLHYMKQGDCIQAGEKETPFCSLPELEIHMTGKTHLSVGTAAAVCVTQPQNLSSLLLCLGTAAIGSVISDIDVTTSESRDELNKITVITVLVIAALAFAEWKWNVGIRYRFQKESSIYRLTVSFLIFLGVCTFGKNQPHRSFMHSLPALVLLSGIVYGIFPDITPYFSAAMLSHMLIDMLNYKNVRILYPLKFGISLDLCHADGLVSKALFHAGMAVLTIMVLFLLYRMYFH